MRSLHLIAMTALLLLTSCIKEELPVPARPSGEAKTMTVCMGPAYQNQVWVDLSSGSEVSTNVKTTWDLAFESDGWRIMLNGSRLMTAWNLGAVDISQATDTNGMGIARKIDAPSGNPDSTAIGDWRGTQNVYVIDMGYNAFGGHMGLRKVKIIDVSASEYTLQWAQVNGSGIISVTMPKDPSCTYSYFSFSNGVQNVEPARGTWDLVFTQYTHQFYVPYLPYMVTGILIDGTTTKVARIPNAEFEEITLADTLANPFATRRDIIGYDWKEYSFETSSYAVDADRCYILRDRAGHYYKLHFTDFYNDVGQAGCPKMEVVPF